MSNIRRLADLPEERNQQQINAQNPFPKLYKGLLPHFRYKTFNSIFIILQLLMFITSIFVGYFMYGTALVASNSSVGPTTESLILLGAKDVAKIQTGEVFRFFTPIFLHASIIHIFFNVYIQLIQSYIYELEWGHIRYLIGFITCGWGGVVMSCICDPTSISVGSSGSIVGLVGIEITYIVFNWKNMQKPLFRIFNIVFFLFMLILSGFFLKFIDNWGHLGGFVTGIIIGCALERNFAHFYDARNMIKIFGVSIVSLYLIGMSVGTFFR